MKKSIATLLVSGLLALVRSAYPDLNAADAINRVIATANPNGHEVPSPIYGNGLIDASAALTADVEPATTTPEEQLTDWIRIHRRAQPPAAETTAPTLTPTTPVPDPAPEVEADEQSFMTSAWTLRYLTVPFTVLVGFGSLAVLLGIGATRHIKRSLRKQ